MPRSCTQVAAQRSTRLPGPPACPNQPWLESHCQTPKRSLARCFGQTQSDCCSGPHQSWTPKQSRSSRQSRPRCSQPSCLARQPRDSTQASECQPAVPLWPPKRPQPASPRSPCTANCCPKSTLSQRARSPLLGPAPCTQTLQHSTPQRSRSETPWSVRCSAPGCSRPQNRSSGPPSQWTRAARSSQSLPDKPELPTLPCTVPRSPTPRWSRHSCSFPPPFGRWGQTPPRSTQRP
mmetsp:Transcript_35675/g.81380  ORF Transcript_35675/g.81380 Transcript_35675/m.81380 type:complete len:235 (-) Transcript_35675:32-736(-)